MPKKLTYEEVSKYFSDNDCELLEKEYINSSIPLNYICSCGNKSIITLSNFKSGNRCWECGVKKRSQKRKHTQKDVEQIFLDGGAVLLDDYKSYHIPMKYICSCGNESKISLANFKSGRRCLICSDKIPPTQEFLYNFYKNNLCILLDTYINNFTKMKYVCKCGDIDYKSWISFRKSCKCKKCFYKENSGENHWNWNNDRNIIRTIEMIHEYSISYKNKFRKKYNISKEYHIDHIIPIKAFVEHKLYDLEIINDENNLRSLLIKDNLSKGGKYLEEDFINYMKQFNKDYK